MPLLRMMVSWEALCLRVSCAMRAEDDLQEEGREQGLQCIQVGAHLDECDSPVRSRRKSHQPVNGPDSIAINMRSVVDAVSTVTKGR